MPDTIDTHVSIKKGSIIFKFTFQNSPIYIRSFASTMYYHVDGITIQYTIVRCNMVRCVPHFYYEVCNIYYIGTIFLEVISPCHSFFISFIKNS